MNRRRSHHLHRRRLRHSSPLSLLPPLTAKTAEMGVSLSLCWFLLLHLDLDLHSPPFLFLLTLPLHLG